MDDEAYAACRADEDAADTTDIHATATEPLADDTAMLAMTPDWELDADAREAALRGDASGLGRFDISLIWRRAWAATDALRQRDEVLLVGTWRR